jgi:signal transduction histidine kinase
MNPALQRVRRRLTLWYVGVFALILIVLGVALLAVLTHQVAERLDRSLAAATDEVIRAAEIRERERGLPPGLHVDAFDELRIPGRTLYVYDAQGLRAHPADAPVWVDTVARAALRSGQTWVRHEAGEQTWRLFARRFTLPDGKTWVAAAAADVVELEDEYFNLIIAFGAAGLGALLLVALGGAALARRSTEPIERAFRQMRRFMADAAHELRTPLTVLRGRAEIALQRGRTAEEYGAALTGIAGEAQRMGDMVEKMLLYSQADAMGLTVRLEQVFLDDILVDAADDARVLATAKGVSLDITDLEESPVRADAGLLRRLFLIVLDNAVQFTPSGGRIGASVRTIDGIARVTIEDTGVGIAPDVLPHIFEPFFRADPAHGRSGGTGLGLALAQQIAQAHEASIRIESDNGRGTRVSIAFPRAA